MELKEAIEKARQILDEERVSPTIRYNPAPLPQDSDRFLSGAERLVALMDLPRSRSQHPRQVLEDPTLFRFESINYNLLSALLSQLPENKRPQFIRYIRLRLVWGVGCARSALQVYPKWSSLISELPLAAEFLVRNGGKAELFATLDKKDTVIIPGHALLLLQLEDMIALNYSVFTNAEYEQLSSIMDHFGERAAAKAEDYKKRGIRGVRWPKLDSLDARGLYSAIELSSKAIVEQCRKARYLYLRGSILEGLNLEVNQDKTTVESYLQQFGFTKPLIDSLNEAERLYQQQATPFELKSSMGHLRSFLENVQKQAMPAIHGKFGGTLSRDWGPGLTYLAQNSVLSRAEEQFAASLYRLMSDEGVHPLIAEREYARLARNMVIEYALLFLRKLDKLGVKSAAAVAKP